MGDTLTKIFELIQKLSALEARTADVMETVRRVEVKSENINERITRLEERYEALKTLLETKHDGLEKKCEGLEKKYEDLVKKYDRLELRYEDVVKDVKNEIFREIQASVVQTEFVNNHVLQKRREILSRNSNEAIVEETTQEDSKRLQ